MERANLGDIDAFKAKHGVATTKRILAFLGRKEPFYTAITSDLGMEILDGAVSRADMLLEKIIDLKATQEETLEFKVLKDLITEWSEKISAYENSNKKLKEG